MKPKALACRLLSAALLIFACGCAAKEVGPFYLVPESATPDGYSLRGTEAVFKNKDIMVSVRQLREEDAVKDVPFLEKFFKEGYIVFNVVIENRSGEKALYNPVYTALSDDALDYKKPLDYTDFYDVAGDDKMLKKDLPRVKAFYFDLDVTVPPGRIFNKYLAFQPLSEEYKSATLIMNDIYVGATRFDLAFEFAKKGRTPDAKKATSGAKAP